MSNPMVMCKWGGVCWAVIGNKHDNLIHASGRDKEDAAKWFKCAYGWEVNGNLSIRRIRWSVVTPAKKPAKKGRKK